MKKLFAGALAAIAALALTASLALAQTPSTSPPYNIDLGPLITNSLRAPGTVTTSAQTNLDKTGVLCVFYQTAVSGTSSSTFAIQSYDSASASYQTLGTSQTILSASSLSSPASIMIHPGIAVSSLPSGMVGVNLSLPRTWRISQTISGNSTSAVTGTIGCNAIK